MAEHERWPAALAHLPVCPVRGLPIPASSGRDPRTGQGRFGVNDPLAKLACGLGRACGVCGRPLGGTMIVFLSADHGQDPAGLAFSDPGMHEPCAGASLALCPYIQHQQVPGRTRPEPAQGKPGWLWAASLSYDLTLAPPGSPALIAFRPGPLLAVRRFRYSRGRLAEITGTGHRPPGHGEPQAR